MFDRTFSTFWHTVRVYLTTFPRWDSPFNIDILLAKLIKIEKSNIFALIWPHDIFYLVLKVHYRAIEWRMQFEDRIVVSEISAPPPPPPNQVLPTNQTSLGRSLIQHSLFLTLAGDCILLWIYPALFQPPARDKMRLPTALLLALLVVAASGGPVAQQTDCLGWCDDGAGGSYCCKNAPSPPDSCRYWCRTLSNSVYCCPGGVPDGEYLE